VFFILFAKIGFSAIKSKCFLRLFEKRFVDDKKIEHLQNGILSFTDKKGGKKPSFLFF
jgi:hypothetical protein